MKFRLTAASLTFLFWTSAVFSQINPSGSKTAINPEKVNSIDSILSTVYKSISGSAGQERNWDEFKALFVNDAKLLAVGKDKEGKISLRQMSTDDFINGANPYFLKNGFFETGIHNVVESFGNIAHVFSTYESRNKAGDPVPFARGINSFQLMHDGTRWWVVSIYWQNESKYQPIPEKYLD